MSNSNETEGIRIHFGLRNHQEVADESINGVIETDRGRKAIQILEGRDE